MLAVPGGREGVRLLALGVLGVVVYAVMGRSVPASGLLMVAVFVGVAAGAGQVVSWLDGAHRLSPRRALQPTAGPAFWSDVETAFAAIEHATTPRDAAVATTWMTPAFASRWRSGFGLWGEARRRGIRPKALLRERQLVTMTKGRGATACVRMVLAPADELRQSWVEHWTFVRVSLLPAIACAACGHEDGGGDAGVCAGCGTPARRTQDRWVVESIASGADGRLRVA